MGIGRIEHPSDGHGARAEAEFTNAIQRWVKDHTCLGIPVLFHEEALHGLQGQEATSFPQAIALASTWNPDLVEQAFAVVGREAAINDAVRLLLRDKFELGLFEEPYVDPARADEISGSAENRKLALETARQAIVLLQNRGGLLPLHADKTRRVAVVGPHAAEVMLGGYSGVPRHSVSILEGIRKRLGADATVRHLEGVRITEDSSFTRGPQPLVGGTRSQAWWSADRVVLADPDANRRRIAEAVALARDSDVVIVVVGDNEQTAREAYAENHLGDRSELRLVGQQEDLVPHGAGRREADGAGADQRPTHRDPGAGRAPGHSRVLVPGTGGRHRGCRGALRRREPGRQAPGQLPPQRGPVAGLLQPQTHGDARLPVRLHPAALPVRARPVVHDLLVLRPDGLARAGFRRTAGPLLPSRSRTPGSESATKSSSSTSAPR